MADIFVSYARSTAAQAQAVADALRTEGYGVWIDEDLPAHRVYSEVIEERLRSAGAVVVVWSAEAAKSEWVQSEADAARAAHKLVQLTVDGAKLPMPFDRIQCADLAGWTGGVDSPGWRKVLASIRDLVGEAVARAVSSPSHSAAARTEPLLAVLAFDNLSSDPEMTYFSDGVSEEILQTVTRGAEVKVIGRGSSFQFRGRDKAAGHVAHALRVTHVLDGAVRRSGNRVRISASLVECAGETMLWSDRFDRELSDVFALQDEIAAAVAAALKVAFAPTTQAETVDPAAYTLYLRAREIRNRGLLSPATVVAVIELLDEATRLAPRFARAWEFLATMQVEHLRFGEPGRLKRLDRADVARAAETALALDPGLGAALQALGQLEPFGHFADREAFQVKALSVAPSDPTVLTNASLFFAEVGRSNDARDYAAQAYALDPMYPWVACWYAYTLEFTGRDQECRRLWETLLERWPDNELITWGALGAAAGFGAWDWFEDLASAARSRGFDSPSVRNSIFYGRQRRVLDADVAANRLSRARERLAQTRVLAIAEFLGLNMSGLVDEAFELIDQASFDYMFDPDKASPNGAAGSSGMFNPKEAGAMMRDVRFVGLCAKLGLCDYWVKTDRWPDCADAVAPYYDFRAEAERLASR
jgi:TolB-like protein